LTLQIGEFAARCLFRASIDNLPLAMLLKSGTPQAILAAVH